MKNSTVGLFTAGAVSFGVSMYKMFVYVSPDDLFSDPVNAYVGGDSYNYIINGNHSTAWMVLAGALIVSAFLCETMHTLKEKNKSVTTKPATITSFNDATEVNPDSKPQQPQTQVKASKVKPQYQHVKGEGIGAWLKKEIL